MAAQQEELGDVKLYRIPEPVTVAAKSQKQVALLQKSGIKVRSLYRQRFSAIGTGTAPAERVLLTRNRPEAGLGIPLPAGRVVLFGKGSARPVLIGRGSVDDKAVGEEVEIPVGTSDSVMTSLVNLSRRGESGDYELTVSNARPVPIQFEAALVPAGTRVTSETALSTRNGMTIWTASVPANGRAVLRYRTEPQS
jgi:hypothetical protein